MSQQQPPPPELFPPTSINYQSPPPYGNAATHVHLVKVFTYISAAADVLTMLLFVGISIFFAAVDLGPPSPGDPPPLLFAIIYAPMGCLALVFGIIKMIAISKFKRLRPDAKGWMLAAGIIGCVQFICGSCCWLQVGAGIYTLVALNLQTVRDYLSYLQSQGPSA